MTFDLVIRNAALPDGRTGQDIALKNGKIAEIVPGLGTDGPEIDAHGQLATPPFMDAHFHIDATLSLGTDGLYNESGTLAEGIALWRRIPPGLTAEDYRDRALRYCDMAVSKGVQAIRSHVDITNADMLAAEVIAEVRREVSPYLDLQLVAFPQMGFHSRPDMADSVRKALNMGFEVVGGIPHLEPTAELGRMADAGLHVMANPPANLHLQARFDTYPKRRGLTRVPELRAAGCVVGFAQDSVLDPWYPLGHGDLLDVAWIAAHACHMTDRAGLRACFDAITTDPARIMGLGGDGLVPGAAADLVLLDATDPIDAIRTRATRTHVIRRGKLICETPPPAPRLSLDGRPDTPARR